MISFEDGGYLYERHTPNRWRFIISALGGSVELVHDDTDLEESYQQWLEERKEKEAMDHKEKVREEGLTSEPRKVFGSPGVTALDTTRYPKHIEITNALGRMETQIRTLGEFCREVSHGLDSAGEPILKEERRGSPTVTDEEPAMSLSQLLSETPDRVNEMTDALDKHIQHLRETLF